MGVCGPLHFEKECGQTVEGGKSPCKGKYMKGRTGPGNGSERIFGKPRYEVVRLGKNEHDEAEDVCRNFQPAPLFDFKKVMDKSYIYGNTEDKKEIDQPVDSEGKDLIRQTGDEGNIYVDQRSEKTYSRKQPVCVTLPAP